MPLELESEIMREIGFGQHFSWYNGSGSCEYVRKQAADKLAAIIKKHHDAGDEIDLPNQDLIETLKLIAERGDSSRYDLTKTWQAASDVIRAHMSVACNSGTNKSEAYKRTNGYLKEHFLTQK